MTRLPRWSPLRSSCALLLLLSGIELSISPACAQNTLLSSGSSASFSYPQVSSPSLFAGDRGYRVVVPANSSRLEIRLEIPSGVQFAIGVKFGSDFQGSQFDADNGGIGNQNPLVVTSTSTPPLRAGTYYIGILVLSSSAPVTGSITATVTSGGGTATSGNTLLTSGVAASYSFPRVTSPTLFSGDFGFRVVVPSGATRLEVRMEIPSGVQFSIGLKLGSDFQGGRFDADNGAIGNENPVIVTSTSNPPLRAGTYYIGIAILSAPGTVSGRITATVSSGTPTISVPSTLDAGSTTVGASRDATFTIRNTGGASLRVTSLTVSRSEFRVVSPATPFDVPASGQQAVVVRFTPAETGAFTATLTIASNDAARPSVTVALAGQATADSGPTVVVSRGSHAFTSTVGVDPPPQTFTIRNSGTGTLTYQLSSTEPWMRVSPTSGSSTGSPVPTTITINVQGLAAGVHRAQIRIVWNGTPNYAMNVELTLEASGVRPLISMSAASLLHNSPVAPGSIAIAAGEDLAALAETATPPLPKVLGGVSVIIKDSAGTESTADLFLASPTRIKYVIPEMAAIGAAEVRVSAGDRTIAAGKLQIESVAPALFSAAADGRGVALGTALHIAADGVETAEPLADCADDACTARAIDIGGESDTVVLSLSGTGIRNSVGGLTALIGGESAEVLGFTPDTAMPGADVVKIRVPRSLAGTGDVDIELIADEKKANVVTVRIGGTPPSIPPEITAVTPGSAKAGERIAQLRITGQYLTAATAIQFLPDDGLTLANLKATPSSVTAEVTVAANAAPGPRTVRVVTAAGTSNELPFTLSEETGDLLPLRTGMAWSYRVTFPSAVDLPYQPVVEAPNGLLCSNVFCGTRRWEAGQIEFQISVNEALPATQSFRATISDPGRVFLFARADPVELRLRTVQTVQHFDAIGTPTGFRLVRPLARAPLTPGGETQTVTVPAGTFNNCVSATITLTGDGTYVRGTFTTEVLLAPGVGLIRAVMRDSTGRTLYTQELTRVTR